MSQRSRHLACLCCALALLLLSAASCSSPNPGTSQQATATSQPGKPSGGQPSSTPTSSHTVSPSPTNTARAACDGQLSDIIIPTDAVALGTPQKNGTTVSCMYRIPQDLKTVDTFFLMQMGKSGWTFLSDNPAGPNSMTQEYFKGQSFAAIILTQHGMDTHTTDATIEVETSK
jgi:hypothetical protein